MSICGLGSGELLVLGVVLVIVFSASRMGALGNAIGKFVYSFKKASRGHDTIDVTPKKLGQKSNRVVDGEVVDSDKRGS